MNKKLLIPTLLSVSLLCSCAPVEEKKRSDEPVDPIPSEDVTASTISEEDFVKAPSYMLRKLSTFDRYKAITKGSTIAKVLFIETEQSIDVTVLRDEYSYLKNESHSNIVNTVHESYYHEKEALYRDALDGEYTLSSIDDYLNIYGTYPFDSALEGYSLSHDAILSVTREKVGESYKFHIDFDVEKSTNNVKIQMKKFGALDDYPVFSSIAMDLYVNDDFSPIKLDLESHYKAKKIMESDCTQKYTVTYSDFNGTINIPNLDNIKGKFSK